LCSAASSSQIWLDAWSYYPGTLTSRARKRHVPKEGKDPQQTAEVRQLSTALPKAVDKAKALGAEELSNAALLDVLEGTVETEVDTIIQRIRLIAEKDTK
jgi:hypothetical protein